MALDRDVDLLRRRILKSGAAASALFAPLPCAWVWAQSEGALRLVQVQKLALVIGNGEYKSAASLRNPLNDAKSIAGTLGAFGFEVKAMLNATRGEMAAAIDDYVRSLAARKCVGLFFYAGHGVQLAWRNFLVPVDARVARLEDVQRECVGLDSLLGGVNKAANPMNVIVLDACRDNPFGADFRVEQKGLSQIDAPFQTLLAYATAPGNVASDGEGANGLYTESLLKEIRVPETKIEDVFKRVRLTVRKRTNGAQLPWESTSLEEDFYFLPPADLTKAAAEHARKEAEEQTQRETQARARREAEDRARREKEAFTRELADWDRIKDSSNPEDFYAYLQKYPSGSISEQAQFRLDRLQKPKVEAAPGASGIKPLASGTRRYAVGDEFVWLHLNRLTNEKRQFTSRVTFADDDKAVFGDGAFVVSQMGAILKDRWGTKNPGHLFVPAELSVGKRWQSQYINTGPGGVEEQVRFEFRVTSLEEVTVPLGTFKAFRIERKGQSSALGGFAATFSDISGETLVDPATMMMLRVSSKIINPRAMGIQRTINDSVTELVEYRPAPR